MLEQKLLRFHEVEEAPAGPGVYAWYCHFRIADRDVEDLLASLPTVQDRDSAVRAFLAAHLFGPFRETPYSVRMTGPLKPQYQGEIAHAEPISPALVSRIAATPARLRTLSGVLACAVPWFASPIYIGCSIALRRRLRGHTRLMQQLREGLEPLPHPEDTETATDHSFARDAIVHRRLDPNELWVAVMPVEGLDRDTALDVENVLNRINFPLCGRN